MERFKHLFGTRDEGVGSAPRGPESMLERIDSRLRIADRGDELLGIEFHDFGYRVLTMLRFGEESTGDLEEKLKMLRMFRQGRLKSSSTAWNVVKQSVIYIYKNRLIFHFFAKKFGQFIFL